MRRLAVVLVLLACAPTSEGPADYHMRDDSSRPTLLVENQTGSHVRVYAGGMLIGTVTAGRSCLDLAGVPRGHIALAVRPTGGPRVRSTVTERMWDRSWEMELLATHRLKFDLLSLEPARSCK